jgi:prefoldin beta subunit
MTADSATENKIQQLQMIEQSLTNLAVQRQQFQSQLVEVESALSEIETTEKVYRIIGNIMVASPKEKVGTDLTSKKEILELRIKNLEKQEKQIKDKAQRLQSDVLSEMKAKESGKDG